MTTPPPTRGTRWPSPRDLLPALGLFAAVLFVTELYLWQSPRLPLDWDLGFAVLLPLSYFGLFLVWSRWGRRSLADYGFFVPRPFAAAIGIAGFLVVLQAAVLLEPGFGFGFATLPPLGTRAFGLALAAAPLTALGQESVFRGYIFGRLLRPGQFPLALGLSAAMFALVSTNIPILGSLTRVELGTYLLTVSVTALALGLVLGIYYYRSGRSLFGPFVFRTGALLVTSFLPFTAEANGWEIPFLVTLLADGVVLLVVLAAVREPKLVARAYLGESFGPKRDRFLGVLRRRRSIRATAIAVAVTVLVVGTLVVGTESALGTTHPFLAIETGSMVPTLERGTLVVIEHAPLSAIRVGTIVAYSTTCLPSPVVHRVIAISTTPNGTVYTTKGDANPSADPCPVPYGSVLGRVVAIVPYVGMLVLVPELTVAVAAVAVLTVMLIRPDVPARFPRRRWFG